MPEKPKPKVSFAGPLVTSDPSRTKMHASNPASSPSPKRQWRKAFLRSLARSGVVDRAAASVGISDRAAYLARDRSPRFAQAWRDALIAHRRRKVQSAENELYRRGVEGWIEPIYQGGELVGHKSKHSDACLVRVLEAEKPRKYARRSESTVTTVSVAFSADARTRLLSDPAVRELACQLAEQLAQPKPIEITGLALPLHEDRASSGDSA